MLATRTIVEISFDFNIFIFQNIKLCAFVGERHLRFSVFEAERHSSSADVRQTATTNNGRFHARSRVLPLEDICTTNGNPRPGRQYSRSGSVVSLWKNISSVKGRIFQ